MLASSTAARQEYQSALMLELPTRVNVRMWHRRSAHCVCRSVTAVLIYTILYMPRERERSLRGHFLFLPRWNPFHISIFGLKTLLTSLPLPLHPAETLRRENTFRWECLRRRPGATLCVSETGCGCAFMNFWWEKISLRLRSANSYIRHREAWPSCGWPPGTNNGVWGFKSLVWE